MKRTVQEINDDIVVKGQIFTDLSPRKVFKIDEISRRLL